MSSFVNVDGKQVHVAVLAQQCGTSIASIKYRVKQCKLSRITLDYLKNYGQQWKLPRYRARMGPMGWEIKYKGQEKWVPYANVGSPLTP